MLHNVGDEVVIGRNLEVVDRSYYQYQIQGDCYSIDYFNNNQIVTFSMKKFEGRTAIIQELEPVFRDPSRIAGYRLDIDNGLYYWTDQMFEFNSSEYLTEPVIPDCKNVLATLI